MVGAVKKGCGGSSLEEDMLWWLLLLLGFLGMWLEKCRLWERRLMILFMW